MELATLQIKGEGDLSTVAEALVPGFEIGQMLLLEGPLGAGKTTLVRSLARALGVPPAVGIRSPTFTLVNEIHGGRLPIVHADFYRIMEDPDALAELGFVELCAEAVTFVEWGASMPEIAAHACLQLSLGFVSGDEAARTLRIECLSHGADRWKPLVAEAAYSL